MTSIINRYPGLFFLIFFSSICFAQNVLVIDPPPGTVCSNLEIKRNNFYLGSKKINKMEVLNLISSGVLPHDFEKTKTTNGIERFYKLKSKKNAYAIVASSTLVLGTAFGFLTYIEGGRTDIIVLSSVFGAVSVGFTVSSVFNAIKFKRQKRELLKQMILK